VRAPIDLRTGNQPPASLLGATTFSSSFADALVRGLPVAVTRRQFLKATGKAGGGLMLAIALGSRGLRGGQLALAKEAPATAPKVYPPAAFIRIGEDDRITIVVGKLEFGQGVLTSMPMLIAEELDCDWSKVHSEHAPADLVYASPGRSRQGTGGSASTQISYRQMRTIGASARMMLLNAAAQRWSVAPETLTTRRGVVRERGTVRSATYGELASDAMRLPVPLEVELKSDPKAFTLIGRPTRRLDSPAKVDGSAQFGIDVQLPELRVAVVARPPVFGGRVARVDQTRARAVPGVEAVLPIPLDRGGSGIAVVARGYWLARQGRDALEIQWDLPAGPTTASQIEQYRALLSQPGIVARSDGDPGALDRADRRIEADYEFPYLAHAMMEPLNATAHLKADSLTIWSGTQSQTLDQQRAAEAAGLKPEQVKIVTLLAGCGFGRRGNPNSDFVLEAVNVAKAMRRAGIEAPVKVIWSREDDIRGGYYRPLHLYRVQVGLDREAIPVAWRHCLVGQSIVKGTVFEPSPRNGVDSMSVDGLLDTPYRVPSIRIEVQHPDVNVPVLWLRGVGDTHTAFVIETIIDEMAQVAGRDPIEYRLALLDPNSVRQRSVLELARRNSGWGDRLPAGRAHGIAMHACRGSVVAHVAEVSIERGRIRVHRVTCAIDCGLPVNPLTIEAQVDSAIALGLSSALYGRITLKNGRVEQSNFPDYPVLRFDEMPRVSVHIVPSTADPSGVGETGTPPIAPAVANAVARLTGKRLRRLPFDLSAA